MANQAEQPVSSATIPPAVGSATKPYALAALEESFDWYSKAAWRAKVGYWISEIALLVVAAAIPASAAFTDNQRLPAALGAVVVVLTGLRTVFQWRDDWLGFTDACARLKTQRAFYEGRVGEYTGGDRDERLVQRVREIEGAETATWATLRRNAGAQRDVGGGAGGSSGP
jgi:hypothetical protein